jgi:hypothetical protein
MNKMKITEEDEEKRKEIRIKYCPHKIKIRSYFYKISKIEVKIHEKYNIL